jgi:hypothetical protein
VPSDAPHLWRMRKISASAASWPARMKVRMAVSSAMLLPRFFVKLESVAWLLRHHIDWDEPVPAGAGDSGGNRVIAPA